MRTPRSQWRRGSPSRSRPAAPRPRPAQLHARYERARLQQCGNQGSASRTSPTVRPMKLQAPPRPMPAWGAAARHPERHFKGTLVKSPRGAHHRAGASQALQLSRCEASASGAESGTDALRCYAAALRRRSKKATMRRRASVAASGSTRESGWRGAAADGPAHWDLPRVGWCGDASHAARACVGARRTDRRDLSDGSGAAASFEEDTVPCPHQYRSDALPPIDILTCRTPS